MAKQKNIRRDIEKENVELRDSLQKEYQLQSNLVDILGKRVQGQRQLNGVQTSLIDEIKKQKSIEDQLVSIQKAKQKIIDKQAKTGKDVSKALLKRLNDSEQFLRVEKAKKDNLEIQKELQKDFKDSLLSTIGLGSKYVKYFKKGGAAALGWIAATKAVEVISDGLKNTVGLGKDLYINFGLSAGESAEIALQTAAASFSIEGMVYGTEAMAEAAKSSIEYFGTISNLTMDSQKNIASLNKLGVDATKSVQLDKIFADAAGDGSDLTDSIKVIAKKEGVTAKKLFEGMADDMSRLVGATEDEIMAMAKTNAQLIKRGFTMKQLEDISNNVLSVEQSMRAEAKARAFIGRDINANGVRQAALALQTARTQDERNAAMLDMSRILEEQVGSADDFNNMSIMQRKLFAEAYGMSVDGITEMLTKQEKFNEYQKEYNGLSDEDILNKIEADEKQQAILTGIIDSGKEMGSLSMAMIPALASFKELGGQNTMIWKGFSKATKGAGNLLKKLYEMTAGKLLGKLGGIGESLGGGAADMVKSKSGKLFDANSPQGKMIRTKGGTQNLPAAAAPKTPKAPKMTSGGGKSMGGMTGAIEKIDAKKLLAGGAALVLVAASVFIFAKAVQEFMKVSWEAVGMAVVSMGALVGALALVGMIMSSGVGAVAILAGAAAMIVIAGAMYVLGKATQQFVPIVETLGDIFIGVLGMIPPIIDSIATGFATMFSSVTMDNIGALLLLGPALMGIAVGLAAVGFMGMPGMLVLTGLSAIAPSLIEMATSVKDLFGFDNEQSESESKESNTMGELLSEIKGLRQDLQAQPIMVNVDGKVVSRISRVQNRQSVSKNGYGG